MSKPLYQLSDVELKARRRYWRDQLRSAIRKLGTIESSLRAIDNEEQDRDRAIHAQEKEKDND